MASLSLGAGRRMAPSRVRPILPRRTPHKPRCQYQQQQQRRPLSSRRQAGPRFSQRLGEALRNSKVQWYQIPIGLGVGFLGLLQIYKVSTREQEKQQQQQQQQLQQQDQDRRQIEAGQSQEQPQQLQEAQEDGQSESAKPKRRPRVRPDGPWQVQVMSTLPLKAISRLWGRINQLTIPYYLRVPGFKLYSYIFGVNLAEVAEDDLRAYPNLAAFFYRQLKPGSRPLHPDKQVLLCPSDGRVIQFGQIEGGDIEQVKGMTYSIDALLGSNTPSIHPSSPSSDDGNGSGHGKTVTVTTREASSQEDIVLRDEEFARVNGIPYTLPELLSGSGQSKAVADVSTVQSETAEAVVGADLARSEQQQQQQQQQHKPWHDVISGRSTSLYYAVVYLAPGDYHRFHSPTNWVVERRRHFAGELYSVSPYLQRTLPGLFTLNERVVLLGRWRWGFFSYIPVGATNVGSIVVNFDRELRTNSLTTDTAADRAAEEASRAGRPYLGFAEASFRGASRVLGGHALRRGDEMGGFQLGSTVVLVFEAPAEAKGADGETKGWEWAVNKGQTVKMGQALGRVIE